MITVNGKVYRNLQEQVEKNMDDIQQIIQNGENMGRIIGHVDDADDLPASPPSPYTSYDYGIAYTVGESVPYDIYTWSMVNGVSQWENQGSFPASGPEGPEGPQGPQGEQGRAGGFGTISVSVTNTVGVPAGTVNASGPDYAKDLTFVFENLKGQNSRWYVGSGAPSITATTMSAAFKAFKFPS